MNGYGPTESTVAISAIEVTKEMIKDKKGIPIGYPITNCTLSVITQNNKEAGETEKGELVVIGDSVSRGYLNNLEMTNKVFFSTDTGKQGYRTGDIVCRHNNILYYLGRKDFQIKLNGFRIEIEDIEENLRKIDNINNAVVLPIKNSDEKISHLVAVVILDKDNGQSNLQNMMLIKKELKKVLPAYMIPRNIEIIKKFPLNVNGKIDKKELIKSLKY